MFLPAVAMWFEDLRESDPSSAALVASAQDVLSDHGPQLGRPLVDTLRGGQWRTWYATHVPLAERRYTAWLAGDTSS